jgi:isoleucyl-tRNA synthetase
VCDTLDVWFDSGVSQYCVLNDREELSGPANLYLEGSDQHRGWFQTSLLTRLAIEQQVPFEAVLTHGYVVDGKGYKMSKSVGNVISPKTVVKQYGADVLRLWVASSDCTQDITVSDAILKQAADAYRRLRNTARFLLSNLDDFDPKAHAVPVNDLLALDRFVIDRVMRLQTEISVAYDAYRVQAAYQLIHHFCTKEMGGFYLDVIKDRLYTCAADSLPRRSAQTTLFVILSALVRWIAPIVSFTAEEIWQHMPGDKEADSVFLAQWFADFPAASPLSDGVDWSILLGVREQVNKAIELERAAGNIGSALDASLELKAYPSDYALLSLLGQELRFFLMTAQVRCVASESATPYAPEITVTPVSDPKCVRCWQRDAEVNAHADYPDVCPRCVLNLSGEGEVRAYV